jgi:hypothetical protein
LGDAVVDGESEREGDVKLRSASDGDMSNGVAWERAAAGVFALETNGLGSVIVESGGLAASPSRAATGGRPPPRRAPGAHLTRGGMRARLSVEASGVRSALMSSTSARAARSPRAATGSARHRRGSGDPVVGAAQLPRVRGASSVLARPPPSPSVPCGGRSAAEPCRRSPRGFSERVDVARSAHSLREGWARAGRRSDEAARREGLLSQAIHASARVPYAVRRAYQGRLQLIRSPSQQSARGGA